MAVNQIKAGAVLSYVSLIVGNVIVLIYTPFMLRMLGSSEYGIYSLCNTITSTIAMLDAGLGIAAVKYIVKYKEEPEKQASAMGVFTLFNLVLGLIAFIITIAIAGDAENIFSESMTAHEISSVKTIIFITGFYLLLSFGISVFQAAVTAYERFVFIKVVDILRTIMLPLLIIPFLFAGYKAVMMCVVTISVFILILLIKMVYCFTKLKLRVSFRNFDYSLIKEALPYSFIVLAKLILDKLFWSEGQMLLGYTSGTLAVAVISISLQMKGYFEAISQSVNNLFLPRCSEYAKQPQGMSLTSDLFVRVCRLQTIMMGLVLSGYIVFGHEFMILWAGSEYEQSFWASVIIMIPCIIPLIQGMGNSILQAFGIVKFQSLVYLGIVIFVAVLTLIFGKQYGVMGTAIIIGAAVIIFEITIMNLYYARIGLDIRSFWKNFVKIILPYAILTAIWLVFIPKTLFEGWLRLAIGIVAFSVVAFIIEYFAVFNDEEKSMVKAVINKIKR